MKYLWLFGENNGLTANNNSYYYWKHIVNIKDNIEKYFVLEKNEENLKVYSNLSKYEKKHILWKNSKKHYSKFFNADLFFITYSFKDILPDKLILKKMSMQLKKPYIHLQSGFQGMKKIDEQGNSYNNNILRFLMYNKEIINQFQKTNDFKDYQLYYTPYQPKYGELVRKNEEHKENQIFWFITDRQYFENRGDRTFFIRYVKRIVEDESLINYLKEKNLTLKVCTHLFADNNLFNEMKQYFKSEYIELTQQKNVDMFEEISKSKLLITDYSSLIYDFAFLKKPSLLFQTDRELFSCDEFYYNENELSDEILTTPHELITKIISEDYHIIPHFQKAIGENVDWEYLKSNKHLTDLYSYFKELQNNKITFMGYNFYGIGGTVNATMALAESLLEKGYFVNLLSLKKLTEIRHVPPYGLNIEYIQWDGSGSMKEKLNRGMHRSPKYYSHLENDFGKSYIHPFVGHELDELMKKIKTNTLVSTRESLHLFLKDCTSENVKNKIYFFHTIADVVEEVYPNLMEKLKKMQLENAVFITDKNRIALKDKFDYDNYNRYVTIGNTLIQSKMIEKEDIAAIDKKDKYSAIYLIRLSKEREKDIDNLIEFGKYVKANEIDNIEIDVFGDGDYVTTFLNLIENNNLTGIINYKSSTENPIEEIRNHDFMIDFSLNHSFGMTYIEAILNGKKVFCMENPGSLEVMENISDSYIESYEWLCDQIDNIDKITKEELQHNYDEISAKYSHTKVAEIFLELIE